MSYLKFQHVFFGLMGMSAITAFAIPSRVVNGVQPGVEALFAPIARPIGGISRWAHDRIAPEISPDLRASQDVKKENQALRTEVANLTVRLHDLEEKESDRDKVGPLRGLCTPFSVIGPDTGTRESLNLQGSSFEGLHDGMLVIYSGGIAGVVQRAGAAGAHVQLITDPGFTVRAGFGRHLEGAVDFVSIRAPQALVRGVGHGQMEILMMHTDEVKAAGLRVGDWAIADEQTWPHYLKGESLGRIIYIGDRVGAPGFARIVVEPPQSLLRLREVLVMTKEK
ncbi:MAG: Cell shape-determining protein MreC [Phycisphaerales bacterium]|nr:Cell shape-determining protein MreC [Phycisphaerales bacterium]